MREINTAEATYEVKLKLSGWIGQRGLERILKKVEGIFWMRLALIDGRVRTLRIKQKGVSINANKKYKAKRSKIRKQNKKRL